MADSLFTMTIKFAGATSDVTVSVDPDLREVKISQRDDWLYLPADEFDDFIGALVRWKELHDGSSA